MQNNSRGYGLLVNLLLFGLLLTGGALLFRQILERPSGYSRTQGPNHRNVGRAMKELRVEPLTSVSTALTNADLEGKVTLINFWGTWCPPCREEMPDLVRLGRVLAEDDQFQLVLVSVGSTDVDELKETTQSYLAKQGWPRQATYHDVSGIAQTQVGDAAQIDVNFPTTLVVDQRGVVRGIWQMYFPTAVEQMESLVRELLEQQEAPS